MQVRNTIATDAKPSSSETVRRFFATFLPTDALFTAARGVGVFLLVAGSVLGGGLVSAQVYRDAVPGSLSYKVKLAIEATQLALAPNDEYRVSLHTEFADRRMDEVSKLSEGDALAQSHVILTLAAFDREVSALGNGLETLKASDPAGVVEVAKLLERKMAVYQNSLRKASALLPPGALRSIWASRDTVDGVTIKAMAVIVEHHLAGDAGAPKAIVITKFEDRIKAAETRLESAVANAPKTTQAKAAIAEAKALIEEEKYEAAFSKIVEVVELTKEEEPAAEEEVTEEEATEEGAEPATEETVTPAEEAPKAETPEGAQPSTIKE